MANSTSLPQAERVQAKGREEELKIRATTLHEQLTLIEERRDQLVRAAPSMGSSWTGSFRKNCEARPVVVGQVLVNVADTTQDWEVELLMPEKRMKHRTTR